MFSHTLFSRKMFSGRRLVLPYAPDLVLKASGPAGLLLRPGYLGNLFPTHGAVAASFIRVGWHYVGEDPSATRDIAVVKSGTRVTIPNNPITDRSVVVRAIGLNANGVQGVHQWVDASFLVMVVNRNTLTPVITQFSTATTSAVTIKVSGFNQFITGRRVTVATNSGFTTGVTVTYFDLTQVPDNTYQFLSVTPTSGTQNFWVKMSHATNGFSASSNWGADSNVLNITFAGTSGGGGSPGGGDPTPPDKTPLLPL